MTLSTLDGGRRFKVFFRMTFLNGKGFESILRERMDTVLCSRGIRVKIRIFSILST